MDRWTGWSQSYGVGLVQQWFQAWYGTVECTAIETWTIRSLRSSMGAAFIPPAKRRLDLVMQSGPCVRVLGLYRSNFSPYRKLQERNNVNAY